MSKRDAIPKESLSPDKPVATAPAAAQPPKRSHRPGHYRYEYIKEEIKSYILKHSLKAGDMLPPEKELARMFGVGHTSVRAAVKSLEGQGLLEARPGAGLFVRSFSIERLFSNFIYGSTINLNELTDFFELRFHVEYGMAESAINAATTEQIEKLRSILAQTRAAVDAGESLDELDRVFHRTLWSCIENNLMAKFVDLYWVISSEVKKFYPEMEHSLDPAAQYKRHANIVKALAQWDLQALQESIIMHYIPSEIMNKHTLNIAQSSLVRRCLEFEVRKDLMREIADEKLEPEATG